ncbi:MAG: hypothetical protein ACYCT0_05970 [Sulfobacillus sp.]
MMRHGFRTQRKSARLLRLIIVLIIACSIMYWFWQHWWLVLIGGALMGWVASATLTYIRELRSCSHR